MQLSLTDLRLFAAVAELSNLTRAAERCHLSLPAASSRIAVLESQSQCRLLERRARGVALTPAGELFARHARSMLREADTLEAGLSAFAGGQQGHVTVMANTTAVTEIMPGVLAGFLAQHPRISVALSEHPNAEIARAVRDGGADLGVVAGEVDLTGLQARHFATDRLVIVCGRRHPLARRRQVAFETAAGWPSVGLYEDSTLQTFLRARLAAIGRPQVRPRVQVNGFEAVCRMAAAGVGVGVVPQSIARRWAGSLELAVVPLSDDWAVRQRYVVLPARDRLPAHIGDLVQAICDWGRREAAAT